MQLPSYIPGLPHFYIPTMNRFGGWLGPLSSVDSTYQLNDTARLIKGRQTLSFGVDYRLLRQNPIFDPIFDFYSRSELGYYGGFSGSDFGDFLLGIPTLVFYAPPVGQLHTQYGQISTFFQDNWKATKNLTINLGLRYEYTSWPTERDNVLASIVPDTGQVAIASTARGLYYTHYSRRVGLGQSGNFRRSLQGGPAEPDRRGGECRDRPVRRPSSVSRPPRWNRRSER
jgi:outer membrane receptor protein involved in Fe transport